MLPVVKAETKFQPVYVDDVAQAAVKGILGQAAPGIYELGGPEVASFRDLMTKMLGVIQRERLVLNVPTFVHEGHGLRLRHGRGGDAWV